MGTKPKTFDRALTKPKTFDTEGIPVRAEGEVVDLDDDAAGLPGLTPPQQQDLVAPSALVDGADGMEVADSSEWFRLSGDPRGWKSGAGRCGGWTYVVIGG